MSIADSYWCSKSYSSIACTVGTSNAYHFKWHRIFFMVVCRVWSSLLMCQMDFPGLCWKASCTLSSVLTSVGSLPAPPYIRHSLHVSLNCSTSAYCTFSTFKVLMIPHLSHWSQLPVPQHPCIQGVSLLVDITAGGDFLGLCDQKSSYKHVSNFGQLWSYGHFLIPVHVLVWTGSYGTSWQVMYSTWWLIVCGSRNEQLAQFTTERQTCVAAGGSISKNQL